MGQEEHRCLHESDWAISKDHIKDMAIDLKAVLKMLRGNGTPGIITKLALQDQVLIKLHERLDKMFKDLEVIASKADQCDRNAIDLKTLAKIVWWILGPTLVVIVTGVVKMTFFGG